MFTFWYPERFNTLKKTFQAHIDQQKLTAREEHFIEKEQYADSAQNFLTAIDVLMNMSYWTAHADDVISLLDHAKQCYVDQKFESLEEVKNIAHHAFNHPHYSTQLYAHRAQYALCTVISASAFYQGSSFPGFHAYVFFRGLVGLSCNYLTTLNVTSTHINDFIELMDTMHQEIMRDESRRSIYSTIDFLHNL